MGRLLRATWIRMTWPRLDARCVESCWPTLHTIVSLSLLLVTRSATPPGDFSALSLSACSLGGDTLSKRVYAAGRIFLSSGRSEQATESHKVVCETEIVWEQLS